MSTATALRVLLVGDDADLDLVCGELRRAGLGLAGQRVVDETDFLDQLAAPWDLVLAGDRSPRLGYPRVLELLASHERAIPVIVVARRLDEDTIFRALRHGAANVVHLDRLDRLAAAVRETIVDEALRAERGREAAYVQASEARLRLALSAAGAAIWDVDLETKMMSGSDGLAALYGLDHDRISFPYADALATVHPADRDLLVSAGRNAATDGVAFAVESRVVLPSGEIRWLSQQGEVVGRTGGGRATRLIGIVRDVTVSKHEEEQVRLSEVRLAEAQRLASVGSWEWDPVEDRLVCSVELNRILGRPADAPDSTCREFLRHVDRRDVARVRRIVTRAFEAGEPFEYECRIVRPDGVARVVHGLGHGPRTADGEVVRVRGTVQDVTEWTEAQDKLRESEAHFRALVQGASDFIVVMAADGTRTYVSPSVERLFGVNAESLFGTTAEPLRHPDDAVAVARFYDDLMTRPGAQGAMEYRVRHGDGSWAWLDVVATNLLHDPAIRGIVVNSRDITDRKALEDQLRHQAFHDALTGLPNRALVLDRLRQALARASRIGTHVAVLFLDLDNFKVINDSLGHATGDELLVAVSRRLEIGSRDGDTIARLGGDEFVCIMEDLPAVHVAEELAARICEKMQAPFTVAGRSISVTASIGVTVSGAPGERADDLLRHADQSMYAAKRGGKARTTMFDPVMNDRARERLDVEADLRHALEVPELYLVYQPIFALETGAITSVEALVRWTHPTRGPVRPSEFIPVAEQTGLIVPLGRWVLEEACRRADTWPVGPGGEAPSVTVNLSARQVSPSLVHEVAAVLSRTGLAPTRLILEITERVALSDNPETSRALCELRELGIRLAIDDFGTGYSGLGALKGAPVDILKIDQSFVAGLGVDRRDTGIIQAVMSMATALGLSTVAEGIETAEQASLLTELGCGEGQGYHLARPMPPHELVSLLGEWGDGSAMTPKRAPGHVADRAVRL